MARDNGQGIFEMSFISSTQKLPLADAKAQARVVIADSHALAKNKDKAEAMLVKARSLNELLLGMSNFSLAHQGLKTIR